MIDDENQFPKTLVVCILKVGTHEWERTQKPKAPMQITKIGAITVLIAITPLKLNKKTMQHAIEITDAPMTTDNPKCSLKRAPAPAVIIKKLIPKKNITINSIAIPAYFPVKEYISSE
jgi:hypothetical protein